VGKKMGGVHDANQTERKALRISLVGARGDTPAEMVELLNSTTCTERTSKAMRMVLAVTGVWR
jgi:hypothetical protein